MQRVCAVLIAAVLTASAAEPAAAAPAPKRSEAAVTAAVLDYPKVARWLTRYPRATWVTSAEFRQRDRRWQVSVFSGRAGQVVSAKVDDRSGAVVEAWVGPEVAWPLARGEGLGGVLNHPLLWLFFCACFLLGLGNVRRPLSMRNLDVLALLSFSVYLAFFNDGRVFASAVAAAASLAYLIARCAWIGVTNQPPAGAPSSLPVWVLVAGLLFLGGLRVGLNTEESGVLDVGYAGVIGADRLANGETPYGNFPRRDTGQPCGPASPEGDIADWIQENGRCETANHLGDTYGPVNYHSYLPGLWLFGWSGKWDFLPAVHFTTIAFDILAMLGLAAVGFRYGRAPLAASLAFAWAANPFTQYVSNSNTNDSIMAAFLIWGFWAASSDVGRGAFAALASWTKLAALIVVPLWTTYPRRSRRRNVMFATAFGFVTLLAFWSLVVGGDPVRELRVFYERTFEIQAERSSPFSLWDWGDYHAAGLPDLKWVQRALQVLLAASAITVAVVPRRKTPLQLAAFTGALIMAFELLLTHWAGLYIVWFFPFVALAVLTGDALRGAPSRAPAPRPAPEPAPAAAPA